MKNKMNKYKFRSVLTISLILFAGIYSFCNADYENIGSGARAPGMGDTFVGLADDIYSIVYNPGGLGNIKMRQFTANYNKLYYGLDDMSDLSIGFFGYLHSISKYPGWLDKFLKKGLKLNITDYGTFSIALQNFTASTLYSENIIFISYGKTLDDIFSKPLPAKSTDTYNNDNEINHLFVGFNFKVMTKSYGKTEYTENAIDFKGNTYGRDPVFDSGYSKTNIAFDFGSYYAINSNYSAGLMIENINQPDTGLKDTSILPLELKAGLCYKDDNINALFDARLKKTDTIFSTGIERFLFKSRIAVRGGFQFGSRELANITCGASYKQDSSFGIDYAFILPLRGIKDIYGTHRINLNIYFEDITAKIAKLKAERQKEERLRQRKEKEEKDKLIDSYINESKSLSSAKQYDMAIIKLQEVLTMEPNHSEAKLLIRENLFRIEKEKKEKLGELHIKAIRLYSENKYDQAIRVWEELLMLNPTFKEAVEYIIKAKDKIDELKKKESQPAVVVPEEKPAKIQLDKTKAEKYYNNGLLKYSRGQLEEAIKDWEETLKYNPNHPSAKQALDRGNKELKEKNK